MLGRFSDKDHLFEMFPLASMNYNTTGTQEGLIIRFHTFYLKIYDDGQEGSYIVQGFRYSEKNPIFVEKVPFSGMRRFASQFTREDYLMGFQQPCEDPNCILR